MFILLFIKSSSYSKLFLTFAIFLFKSVKISLYNINNNYNKIYKFKNIIKSYIPTSYEN